MIFSFDEGWVGSLDPAKEWDLILFFARNSHIATATQIIEIANKKSIRACLHQGIPDTKKWKAVIIPPKTV